MEKQMSKNEEKTTETEYLSVMRNNKTGEWIIVTDESIISDPGIDHRSATSPAKTTKNRMSAR
jgi:CTP:phosphocholine cytidylyltransferase-like protein